MQKRRLGRTDIHVSAICLGTMTWGEQNTEADGHAQMDLAFDRGVNFMDTASSTRSAQAGDAGAHGNLHRQLNVRRAKTATR